MFRTFDQKNYVSWILSSCCSEYAAFQCHGASMQSNQLFSQGMRLKKFQYLVIGVPATKRMVYCLLPECSFSSNPQIWSESFLACIYSWLFWTIVIPVPYFGQEIFVRSWGQILRITSLVHVFMRQRDPSERQIGQLTRIWNRMDCMELNSCLRYSQPKLILMNQTAAVKTMNQTAAVKTFTRPN